MFELKTALSYLIPRKGRLSQSVTTLIAVLVISTIVWLSLVYFSTIDHIEEKWTTKIQAIVGKYEILPTAAYLDAPSSKIDAKNPKYAYSVPRLSLHKNDTLPLWDEEQDGPLEEPLNTALKSPLPIAQLISFLEKQSKPFSWHFFEQQVVHAQITTTESTVSQYVMLRGISSYTQSLEPIPGRGYPCIFSVQSKKQGVRLGDTVLFDSSPSLSSIKGFVAGFFDPGILPIGAKLVLCSPEVVTQLSPALALQEPISSSGIVIQNPGKVDLKAALQKNGLSDLFIVRSFDSAPMTEELFLQLKNEHTLFQLLSSIFLFVASANILSMLFLIARDRKKEIALVRALGLNKRRLTLLFTFAGFLTGCVSFALGCGLAATTLHFLPECLSFLSWAQGRNILDPAIFGTIGPSMISMDSLFFCGFFVFATATGAGILASLYATRISISEALKEP